MKERILDLADYAHKKSGSTEHVSDQFCLIFAEQIIQECLKVVNAQVVTVDEPYNPKLTEATWNACINHTHNKIKKHFGLN